MGVTGQHTGGRIAALGLAAMLAGCVDSAAPLLDGAKPLLGPSARLHMYSFTDGKASGPTVATFRWDGTQYRVVGRATFDVAAFTAVAFEGDDLIVQSTSSRPQIKGIEYALAHKVADGAYLVSPIDEDDADAATRANMCAKGGSDSCRVASRDALIALAHASAAKIARKGALVVVMGGR